MSSQPQPTALFLIIALFSGCANPTYTNQSHSFRPVDWQTVAIMPFTGDPEFSHGATQSFAAHVMNVPGFRIIQASTISAAVRHLEIVPTQNGFTVLDAQKVGQSVDADAMIIGTVSSYNNGATLNGFCTAQVIDVASGEIVAVSHNPSGKIFGFSEHHAVMAATERTGKEILKVLNNLSRKNRATAPPLGTLQEKDGASPSLL